MLFALCVFPISQAEGGQEMGIKIEGSAFKEGGMIPVKYTCDGEDVSPPLKWGDLPTGTRSIALISDDPDAPVGTWVHWVLYNLPPDVKALPENIPPKKTLENGAVHGTNDFKRLGYGGPCPPGGTHRYFFKIYALDKKIDLAPGATKAQLVNAMEGHILDSGQLMGKYKR
jgi:Raf kinase inhibitor-like YbhB/YbcL family protein